MEVLPSRKVLSARRVSQRDNMRSTDFLISLREKFLDLVSGSDRSRALNQVGTLDANPMMGDPAAELADLLHEVSSRELADHGENVDYAALRAISGFSSLHHQITRV
jgi:hypothetical protein